MQEVKPIRVILDAGNNNRDTENIKGIHQNQAQGNEPGFLTPGAAGKGNDAKTNVSLLHTGARPNDPDGVSIGKMDAVTIG